MWTTTIDDDSSICGTWLVVSPSWSLGSTVDQWWCQSNGSGDESVVIFVEFIGTLFWCGYRKMLIWSQPTELSKRNVWDQQEFWFSDMWLFKLMTLARNICGKLWKKIRSGFKLFIALEKTVCWSYNMAESSWKVDDYFMNKHRCANACDVYLFM